MTEQAWVAAGDICDVIGWPDSEEVLIAAVRDLDLLAIENLYWKFYSELALCALDSDNVHDLYFLALFVLVEDDELDPAMLGPIQTQGNNLGVILNSLRDDMNIPNEIGDLIELGANAGYYIGATLVPGRAIPNRHMSRIGQFLHDQFFKKTRELVNLNLGDPAFLGQKLLLPASFIRDVPESREYLSRNEAVAALTAKLHVLP